MTQFHGTIEETVKTETQTLIIRKNIPAFPVQKYDGSWIDGMDLRDYFAAKAMQTILAGSIPEFHDLVIESTAEKSYLMADAMIKAREE